MAITVEVAGTDRTEYWFRGAPTNWEDPLNARGTGRITFEVPVGAGFAPEDGQTIEIIEDGSVRFGGILLEPEETEPEASDVVFYSCVMADYNLLADRRIVAENWEDTAFETIVSGIVSNHMDGEGITINNVSAGAAETLRANLITATEAFNSLSDATGRAWYIDQDKDLHFFDRTENPAPADLDGTTLLQGSVTVRSDRQKYRNQQTVIAGPKEFPIIATSGNLTEQAARAAIEGTSGIYENVHEEPDITDQNVAMELAGDLLERFDEITQVVRGRTRVAGFRSGQSANVDLPKHGINNVTMLLLSVTAEVINVAGDDEIWYTVEAITGEPYGGWMEHFRNPRPRTVPLTFENVPGLFRVDPTPGVVVHDPPPGPFEWFQGAASGTLDRTPAAVALTHHTATTGTTDGATLLLLARGPVATPRQTILGLYPISSAGVPSQSPDVEYNWDELFSTNVQQSMAVSPDNSMVAYYERNAGSDPVIAIASLTGSGLLGSVTIVGGNDNNSPSEPIWVGDYIFWPKLTTGDIHIVNASDPNNPVHVTDFSTSLTDVYSIVANRTGSLLFATGNGSQRVVSLDITTPGSPVEDDAINVTGDYSSLDIDEDDARLAMAERADASNVRVGVIDLDGSTLDTLTETTIPFASSIFEGLAAVFEGDRLIAASQKPASVANSYFTLVFAIPEADPPTLVQEFNYNHGISGNVTPFRTTKGRRIGNVFNFNTDAQITYGEATYKEPVPLTIDNPLRVGFGGTGLGNYLPGDLIYADRVLPDDSRGNGELSRLAIGDEIDTLIVSGEVPAWASFAGLLAFYNVGGGGGGGGAATQQLCMGADVEVASGALTALDELEATVVSGECYYFRAEIFYEADPSLGHAYAIGGTCTGDVRYQIRSLNDDTGEYSLIVSGQKSALDESAGEDTSTRGYTEISGSIDVTSNGTLVPYFGTYN